MSSRAYTEYLEVLLADAKELDEAHKKLRTKARGRQWGLGALNRASVVMCVSAWESYLEEVLRESLEGIRPVAAPVGPWAALKAGSDGAIGRFNTPNAENTRKLFASCLGIADITNSWRWRHCDPVTARRKLNEAMTKRHEIAHGVNPRPIIHNNYSEWLPGFFRNLGRCTDRAVRGHLVAVLGVAPPW